MKCYPFILSIILCLCFSAVRAQKGKKETVSIKTAIYCSHCLECKSCGKNISSKMARQKGVAKCVIDPDNNTITVTYNPARTNVGQIKKAISETGYDADEVKALPDAYQKLDGCCKKG